MAYVGDYELCWADADAEPSSQAADAGTDSTGLEDPRPDQYIFAARVELPMNLRRARTAQDLLLVLAGGDARAPTGFAVATLGLLFGNLAATGQWILLLAVTTVSVIVAVLEWRGAAQAVAALQACLLIRSLWQGFDLQWLILEVATVLGALIVLALVLRAIQEDPRSHALLLHQPSAEVLVRNDCCHDVKLLVFDGDDNVRLVPRGGLLGGVLLRRGATRTIGGQPPYVVKVYAPFARELGTFRVQGGLYSLRATAPALILMESKPGQRTFRNASTQSVDVCVCQSDCWTGSLWLPCSQVFTRLLWSSQRVKPKDSLSLHPGPCFLRVYRAGPLGFLQDLASCSLWENEKVEYEGRVTWTVPRSSVHRSCSALFSGVG